MHTARIWMASATPGGAPGYDYDKEFGNNIAHSRARTSQRLRGYTVQPPEVKGRTRLPPFWQCNRVPAVRRGGILCVQPCGTTHLTTPLSFRDGPKDQTRNLEILQCAIAHRSSLVSRAPRNDGGKQAPRRLRRHPF